MKQETINRIRKFTEDRDWDQFHSPANLAKSIVIEAAELLLYKVAQKVAHMTEDHNVAGSNPAFKKE